MCYLRNEERMSKTLPGDIWIHHPLPYIVYARVIVSEDMASEAHAVRLLAYSSLEAMFQASMQLGASGIDDASVKVERVEPDITAFASMIVAATRDNVHTRT